MHITDRERGPEGQGAKSFVVNLCAATTPVALTPPEGPEFQGFQCFITRRREAGRDRFRMHLGYFTSLAAARDKVEDLRHQYPMAWAGPAPQTGAASDSPSIDDTLSGLSNVREVLAALDSKAADAEPAVLTPMQELALLETGRLPEPCFAVQLAWSDRPIDPATLPQPALFDVYTLYNVEGTRAGQRWYGLRLGFFTDTDAAKRVASYLKPDFTSVVVVQVTAQERECASGDSPGCASPASIPAPIPAPLLPCSAALPDPFEPEPSMLPARLGPTVAERPAKPAPFELLPLAAASSITPSPAANPRDAAKDHARPASPPAQPSPPEPRRPAGKRVKLRGRPLDPGRAAPDTQTLECLGASTLQIAEELRPTNAAQPAAADSEFPVSRRRLGLAKWFGRRSA